tara:strand:- start:2781 stop:2972 length:192 start_codon:yes stop_codon:yes gene_type:complete
VYGNADINLVYNVWVGVLGCDKHTQIIGLFSYFVKVHLYDISCTLTPTRRHIMNKYREKDFSF